MNAKVRFIVSVVLACAVIGTAAEVEWTGKGADDLWSTAGNWQGGKTPGASDVIMLRSPPERGPVISGRPSMCLTGLTLRLPAGGDSQNAATASER
ncbi:MAG: hypothetical protein ACYS29_18180 [Planctomycetota bacterium]